jgi:hypothetical protein
MYKCESIPRYILNDVEKRHHLISIRFYFILAILITEDDHNHIVFNNCNSAGFSFIDFYIILNTCFIYVLQELSSSQINLCCLSAEISKHQRYRSILHV